MIRVAIQTIMNRLIICGFLIVSSLIATESHGDKIYLKDGSVEQSDRIWESDQYVHFILKGTQGVEIRYAKEIVERIERLKPHDGAPAPAPAVSVEASDIKVDVAKAETNQNESAAGQGPAATQNRRLSFLPQLARENKGLLFYDPRRPMRYWAMRNSKHKELTSALDTMARVYDRSAEWVETHMGQDNELGKIHHHLAQQYRNETAGRGETVAPNPDRHDGKTPLADDTADGKHETMPASGKRPFIRPQTVTGIRFYDPRRVEKYWSGQMTRHHTLKEALNSLAQQYGITASWIEANMGDTNDLSVIHRNIQKNLKKR